MRKQNNHKTGKTTGKFQQEKNRIKGTTGASTKGITSYAVEEPTELLPFLLQVMKNNSRNSVKSILTRGQVNVDGKPVKQHNHPLIPGQVVGVLGNKEAMQKTALVGITILHEDDDIIVIDKEAGLLSMASKDPSEMTAYRQLSSYVKEENRANRIFVVHRLDRDTSGVMLFAKSEDVKEALQKDWKDIVKERIYTALVEGVMKDEEGTISSWLTESKAMKVHSSSYDNGGKHAVTHYKKIRGNKDFTLLEVQLETGRKNQIRVHMEELGHPIAGDKKYGAHSNPLKRLGLHATTLALIHPRTGELVRYSAKVPKVFLLYSK
jgi:23S rRNA pseudouridine1911/1915/1917 synthase